MSAPRHWALILGASSGFGAAAARAFAAQGYDILGVHLDRRSGMPAVEALVTEIEQAGVRAHFINTNAAADASRKAAIDDITELLQADGSTIDVLLHSLAFGTLTDLVTLDGGGVSRKQLEMTIDVMANSLVYWTQDLVAAKLFGRARIFALTSSGSHVMWSKYGPVSAAKTALESHVRQLCLELAPLGITVNALMPGVTQTAALSKVDRSEALEDKARSKNPHNRLTLPEDVAACLVELARPGTYWMTGNTIRVDGGEDFCA